MTMRKLIFLAAGCWLVCGLGVASAQQPGPPVQRNVYTTNRPQDVRLAIPVVLEAADGVEMSDTGAKQRLQADTTVARTNKTQTFYGNLSVRTNLDVLNTVTAATGIFSGRIIGNLAQATNLPVNGISATGTRDASTYLRGDGSWAVPPFITNNDSRSLTFKMFGGTRTNSFTYTVTINSPGTNWYRIAETEHPLGGLAYGEFALFGSRNGEHHGAVLKVGTGWKNPNTTPWMSWEGAQYSDYGNVGILAVRLVYSGSVAGRAYVDVQLANRSSDAATSPLTFKHELLYSSGWGWKTFAATNVPAGSEAPYSDPQILEMRFVRVPAAAATKAGKWYVDPANNKITFSSQNIDDDIQFKGGIRIGSVGFPSPAPNNDHVSVVAIGYGAAESTPSGQDDIIAIGRHAARHVAGQQVTAIGSYAAEQATNAVSATMLGYRAGAFAAGATNMVAIGRDSALNATNSGWSVFIGDTAGRNFENSPYNIVIGGIASDPTSRVDRLMIHSRDTTIPLLYGEFDNRLLRVHGWLDVTNKVAASLFQGNAAGLTNLPVSGISASGTRDASTFLRGDGTWSQITGIGTVDYVDSEEPLHITVTTNDTTYTIDIGTAVATTNRSQRFYQPQYVRNALTVEGQLKVEGPMTFATLNGAPIWTMNDYTWDWASSDNTAVWNMQTLTGINWNVPYGYGLRIFGPTYILGQLVAGTVAVTNQFAGNGSGLTNIPVSGLATTGTRNATNYLRGDGSWGPLPTDGYFIVAPRATGNATTDWNNLQAALDETTNAPSYYGARTYVLLPPGGYVINQRLILRAHGITVLGAGIERTRIYQQSATEPVFDIQGLAGWTWGGYNQLWWARLENFGISKQLQTVASSTSSAIDFVTDVSGQQQASRLILHRLKINNFYIGVRIGHGVGLDASHLELYGNNYGLWLSHADNTTLKHVYVGDAEDSNGVNQFGTNQSAGVVYTTHEGTSGRALLFEAFEARRVQSVLKATNGNVVVRSGNIESMRTGPMFVFSNPWNVIIESIRGQRTSANTEPWIDYIGNPQALNMRNFMTSDDLSSSARVRLVTSSTVFPYYEGTDLSVTNYTLGVWRTLPVVRNTKDGAEASGQLYATTFVGNASGLTNLPVSGIAASGTRDSTTFLRGDGQWAVPPGGGGGGTTEWVTSTNNNYIYIATNGQVFTVNAGARLVKTDVTNNWTAGQLLPYAAIYNLDAGGTWMFRGQILSGLGDSDYEIDMSSVANFTIIPPGSMTIDGGLAVNGNVSATSFAGSGASLTSLNASQLTTGTVPEARLPSTVPRTNINNNFYGQIYVHSGGVHVNGNVQATNATVTGTVTAGSFSGSGANLTSLNASQLTSGTVPEARLPSTVPRTNINNNFYGQIYIHSGGLNVNGNIVATNITATGTLLAGTLAGNAGSISNVPVSGIAASGTRNSSTFLRGDGVWAVPSGGGGGGGVDGWTAQRFWQGLQYNGGYGGYVINPAIDTTGSVTDTNLPRTFIVTIDVTNHVKAIIGPTPTGGSFFDNDELILNLLVQVNSGTPRPLFVDVDTGAGMYDWAYMFPNVSGVQRLWTVMEQPELMTLVFRYDANSTYWKLVSVNQPDRNWPLQAGQVPVSRFPGDVTWMSPAFAPGTETISIWAQVPNSGTTPASSPGGSTVVDTTTGITAANSMTDQSGTRDIPNISFSYTATDVTGRVRYGGNLMTIASKYYRLYHVIAVDHPDNFNVWAGMVVNPGGQNDWPGNDCVVFVSTNSAWHVLVRVGSANTIYEIGETVTAGKRYVLSFIRHANGDVGAYINGQLRAVVPSQNLPGASQNLLASVWVRSKTTSSSVWRWYKSQFDYRLDN